GNRKPETGNRKPETGNRKPETGNRKPETGNRKPAFGLSGEWLVHDGKVIPSVIALSHDEQLARLREDCPEALPAAIVVGDPVADQLVAAAPFRETYRTALGLLPGQRLLVVSSTWGTESTLGAPDSGLLRRIFSELPADEWKVLVALHPNAWFGHSPWQWENWLGPYLDSGLILPAPETEVWKAALCAADAVIGDHGSLTMYAVHLGIPTLLGAFADAKVAAPSPMERLGEALPRVSASRPLRAQLETVAAEQPGDADIAALGRTVTSRPGEAAALLRRLFYARMELPEPACPATTRAVPVPSGVRADRQLPYVLPAFVTVETVTPGRDASPSQPEVLLRRYPAALQHGTPHHLAGAHLCADPDMPDVRWPRAADVLLVPLGRFPSPGAGDPAPLAYADLAGRFPGCLMVAVEEPGHGCLLLLPDGRRLRARWRDRPQWADFAAAASAVHGCAAEGSAAMPAPAIRVRAGGSLPGGLLDIAVV
ncbi:hypothetical protein, partial [Streptomyces sp. NPDC052225]|uniref:hypothetical protein n=1 Tax=Streptomyces sp. NPDC052225 TaxID=3154949 RepID=UPI0034426FA6